MKTLSVHVLTLVVAGALGSAAVGETMACNLTPAQAAADQAAANAIINGLAPLACDVVDVVDPSASVAACQVVTDIASGATAVVPVIGTIGEITALITARPTNAAVQAALVSLKSAVPSYKTWRSGKSLPAKLTIIKGY